MSLPHPDGTPQAGPANVGPEHPGAPHNPGSPHDPGPPNPYADPSAPPPPGAPPPYAPGYPPGTPGAAPKKSRVGRTVAIIAGALVLLLVLGGTILYLTVGDKIADVATSTQTRMVMPDQLGGRDRNNQPEFVEPATRLVTMLKQSQPAATSTIGGFYGTGEKQDLAMVAGTSGTDLNPAKTLNDVVSGMNQTLPLTGLKDVEPGPLGGQARCGAANAGGVPIGVCLWTDAGSTGMLLLYFRTAEQAEGEFVTLRGEVEQRS